MTPVTRLNIRAAFERLPIVSALVVEKQHRLEATWSLQRYDKMANTRNKINYFLHLPVSFFSWCDRQFRIFKYILKVYFQIQNHHNNVDRILFILSWCSKIWQEAGYSQSLQLLLLSLTAEGGLPHRNIAIPYNCRYLHKDQCCASCDNTIVHCVHFCVHSYRPCVHLLCLHCSTELLVRYETIVVCVKLLEHITSGCCTVSLVL